MSSSSKMYRAKQWLPGARTDRAEVQALILMLPFARWGSLNCSAPTSALCAAASEYSDLELRGKHLLENWRLCCVRGEKGHDTPRKLALESTAALGALTTQPRARQCGLRASLQPGKLANVPFLAQQPRSPPRACSAKQLNLLALGMLGKNQFWWLVPIAPLKTPLWKPIGSFSREKSAEAKYP